MITGTVSRVEEAHLQSAELMRLQLASGTASRAGFRSALTGIPALERDRWVDAVFGLGDVPVDGDDLPRGCVPYLPCSVDTLLRMIDVASVQPDDVFVDIGCGVGRAAALTHFLTGAAAVGVEVQADLVRSFRKLTRRLNAARMSVIEGDAAGLTRQLTSGTVFFLYCPFGGARLERVFRGLEVIARQRKIRVCCVSMPHPACPWLTLMSPPSGDLAVYSSSAVTDLP